MFLTNQQIFEQQFPDVNYTDLIYIGTPINNGVSIYKNKKNNKFYKYNLFTKMWEEKIKLSNRYINSFKKFDIED